MPAGQGGGDLAADGDHLEAVVGVRRDVDVGQRVVEDGEAVGGEGAQAPGAHLPVLRPDVLEAAKAVGERRAPHVRELVVDVAGRVRVHLGELLEGDRRGAALDGVLVRLDVDAPRLVGDEAPAVVQQRRGAVDVQDRRRGARGRHEGGGIDVDLALLQVPGRPHRHVVGDGAVGLAHVEGVGLAEHLPQVGDPRADGDHDLLDLDRAPVCAHRGDGAGLVAVEADDLDARGDLGARRLGEAGQALDRRAVVGEAARRLVQADRQPARPPVREQRAHVGVHRRLADDQLRGVAEALVPLEDLLQVGLLVLRTERDVPARVVTQGLGVLLPDLHAGGHQLAHRGLEVVVAHDAAGDAGRPRGHPGLVDHEHVGAALRQVPGGGEAVHPRSDDEHVGLGRDGRRHGVPPERTSVRRVWHMTNGCWQKLSGPARRGPAAVPRTPRRGPRGC